MLIHPNKKGENILNFPFFKRSQTFDTNLNTSTSYSYKYTLLGVARNVLSGIDIYDTYFHRKYTKQYDQLRGRGEVRLELHHFSKFFIHFIHIFAIKSLIERQRNTTLRVDIFTNNLFGIRAEINQQNNNIRPISNEKQIELTHLQNCLKPLINNIFQKLRELKDNQIETIKQVQKLLQKRMELIEQDLENSKLLQNVYLPNGFQGKQLKRFFMNQFKCIINLEVFQMHARKEILSLFVNINRNFMLVKIPYTMESTIRPKDMLTFNDIILPRYTNERDLIATKLSKKRISRIKENEKEKEKERSEVQYFLLSRFEVIRDVVSYLSKYYKSTNHFYPNLAISDLYFDERQLRIFISHHPLILDAIGLNKPTKQFQLALATDNTPQFDPEPCHLQYKKQNMVMLKQKYYFPSQYRRVVDEDQDLQDKQKNANESLAKLQEQIHVWRLLNILYFISHEKYLSKSLYPHYYWRNQEQKPSTPFRFDTYKNTIKQLYEDIAQNAHYLIELLPPIRLTLEVTKLRDSKQNGLDNVLKKQLQPLLQELSLNESILLRKAYRKRHDNKQEFKFTLQDVRLKFDIVQEDDSLFESLKISSIKSQLYIRFILVKEINNLLIDKRCFKKFMNAKKYMLLYMIAMFEELYLILLDRKNSNTKPAFKKQLQNELEKEFNHIVFSVQLEKRKLSKKACQEKLNGYQQRDDANKRFLATNRFYTEHSKMVKKNIEQVFIEQIFQSEYLSRQKLTPQQIEVLLEDAKSFLSESEQSDLRVVRSEFLLLDSLQETLTLLKKPVQVFQRAIIDAIFQKFILDPDVVKFQEIGQIFQPLFRDSENEKIIDIIFHLRERQDNNQYKKMDRNQFVNLKKQDLIIQVFRSLRGKKRETIEKLESYLKRLMFIDEGNQNTLIQKIQDFQRKILHSLEWKKFKELWKAKIDRKIEHSYKILFKDIERLTLSEIQPYVKIPESFHKIADFTESKAGADLCIYYNNKLLTLLKIYLSIDGSNWRQYQPIYNMIQIEDKTINIRTSNTPIEKCLPEIVKLQNTKLLLLKERVEKTPKDIASVFINRQQELRIGQQSLNSIPDRIHNQQSRQTILKQTFDG